MFKVCCDKDKVLEIGHTDEHRIAFLAEVHPWAIYFYDGSIGDVFPKERKIREILNLP